VKGGLMVCGTASDVGKTHVVTGLCRLLARRGVRVAPFKAQNMALNSFVTPSGHEIGRSQGVQALAARTTPHVTMNPILLKPTGDRSSQVVVMGEPWAELDAAAYHEAKPHLLELVMTALQHLRNHYDVVILEGAGSPTEINLLARDIVNLRVARDAGLNAIVIGDIDRGGVFASLYGTVALLPDDLRVLVKAFVINKLRGDPALLLDGTGELERRCGVPTIGVLPWVPNVALDAEDSLALDGWRPRATGPAIADTVDVVVVRLPRMSNFTDVDPLGMEPGVHVRMVTEPSAVGSPDLIVIPGTKATVADLRWLQHCGFVDVMARTAATGTTVLGICGGYQMMGATITDTVESGEGAVAGLGWLEADTLFEPSKVTRQRRGTALGHPVTGYQIHHGRVRGRNPWLDLINPAPGETESAASDDGSYWGTTLHGLFEEDIFRSAFLRQVADRRGKRFAPAGVSFAAAREAQVDRLADLLEDHLDLDALTRLIEG
jgi:adenosylcobyric acid synthase